MRKQERYIFLFSLSCKLEASYKILLAFITLRAKQAIKKAACMEETNVVQQLGKMHEVYQLEI